jgi:GDP-D-mannose dehydratase
LKWTGTGLDEKLRGRHKNSKDELILVEISDEFFRPGEVPYLRGDS